MKKIIKFLITNIIIVLILIISINSYVIITTKNKIITSNTSIEKTDCIIVLGAGLRNDKPSLMLEWYFQQNNNEWRSYKKKS